MVRTGAGAALVVGAAGGVDEVLGSSLSLVVGAGGGGGGFDVVVSTWAAGGSSLVDVGSGFTSTTGSGVFIGSSSFSDDFVTMMT